MIPETALSLALVVLVLAGILLAIWTIGIRLIELRENPGGSSHPAGQKNRNDSMFWLTMAALVILLLELLLLF